MKNITNFIKLQLNEFYILLRICYLLPFGFRRFLQLSQGRGPAVIFVHGYGHNLSAWLFISKLLKKSKLGPCYALSLSSPMTRGVEDYARELQGFIRELGVRDLLLVGHSMGGVIAAYFAEFLAEETGTNILGVTTLGSPLRGCRVAIFGPGLAARDLEPGSLLLGYLGERVLNNPSCAYIHHAACSDQVVFPNFKAGAGVLL